MTYRITGLPHESFAPLFALDDTALAAKNARRVVATSKPGFQCRISLEEAEVGEPLLLVNHLHHDVTTPYRSSYAIYVRENVPVGSFASQLPPMLVPRHLALRGFAADGTLLAASLAGPGEGDTGIRALFEKADIAYIHLHNAAHGCFAARVDRR